MTRHCQTKWCQRQHSTWCLLRAHPSADSKSVSTGNSELCWFYSDWLHFRNCAGGKKKNHFLSEKESLRKMVHHDLKMHTEVNHVNSEAMAPSKKKKNQVYTIPDEEKYAWSHCATAQKRPRGPTHSTSTAALGWKSLHCPRVRFLTNHWHSHLLDKRCYRSGYVWVYWIKQLTTNYWFEAVTPDC